VVGGIIGFALVFTAFPIAHAFLPEQPEVADIAAWYIIIVCATEILFSYSMVLSGALQGAGDVNATFVMAVVCLWGIRVPLAAVLALPQFFNLGAIGVWIAMSASQSVNGLYAMWLWKKGKWKLKEV
ncbi:MAG: MATE family efflux transporter, partial [Fimbriimonadaceae bacterium]